MKIPLHIDCIIRHAATLYIETLWSQHYEVFLMKKKRKLIEHWGLSVLGFVIGVCHLFPGG